MHAEAKLDSNESHGQGSGGAQGRDVHVAVQLVILGHHCQDDVAAIRCLAQAAPNALHHGAAQRLFLPAGIGSHV